MCICNGMLPVVETWGGNGRKNSCLLQSSHSFL